jgi:hypothetical protein
MPKTQTCPFHFIGEKNSKNVFPFRRLVLSVVTGWDPKKKNLVVKVKKPFMKLTLVHKHRAR